MNVGKRKSDECHYCANQKRHERKRSKLTISDRSNTASRYSPMVPLQGNFKCRGRGGKEIEFPSEIRAPLKNLQRRSTDVSANLKMNFKSHPEGPAKFGKPEVESSQPNNLARFTQATVRRRSDSSTEVQLLRPYTRPELSLEELSFKSKNSLTPELRLVQSADKSMLRAHSDGDSSTDDSVKIHLNRSRNPRKAYDIYKQVSRNNSLKSTLARKHRNSQSMTEQASVSSRMSNSSVHDYLVNVSEELRRDRLIGKLEQPDGFRDPLDRSDHCGDRFIGSSKSKSLISISSLTGHRLKRKPTFHRSKAAKSTSTDHSLNTERVGTSKPVKKGGTFWSRVFYLFSLGCWKSDVNSSSSSVDRKLETNFISGYEESHSSESRSTSTGTTTVAACGRMAMSVGSGDLRNHGENQTAAASRCSSSGDHKLMAAKLVESLKRFFSSHRKSECEQQLSDSCSSTSVLSDEESEPSPSAPLKTKQQHSYNPKPQHSLEIVQKASASSDLRQLSSPESEDSNKRLLGHYMESPVSTDIETSDAEIVDICPMHKQPI